jgi:hypothetical protein
LLGTGLVSFAEKSNFVMEKKLKYNGTPGIAARSQI